MAACHLPRCRTEPRLISTSSLQGSALFPMRNWPGLQVLTAKTASGSMRSAPRPIPPSWPSATAPAFHAMEHCCAWRASATPLTRARRRQPSSWEATSPIRQNPGSGPTSTTSSCRSQAFHPVSTPSGNVWATAGSRSHWYFRGDRLLAVDAMNDPRAYMVAKRLIEAGKSPPVDAVSRHHS